MKQISMFPVNADGGKGGKLIGEVTEEMLDSSASVLQSYMGRGTRGLQQFFTPPEAAELIAQVFGPICTFDLTAGNGGILNAFPEDHRFGIEIDQDMIDAGEYCSITADLQKLYPLMKRIDLRVPGIAINPPFGLQWEDASLGKMNSTVMTYLYALNLLQDDGQGVLIAGANRFDKEIMGTLDEANKIYAIIECDNLFTNADIPSVIAFFTTESCDHPERWSCARADIPFMETNERVQRLRAKVLYYTQRYSAEGERVYYQNLFRDLQIEYAKRYAPTEKPKFSISLTGKKIKASLSAYDKLALNKVNKLRNIEMLHNQASAYFALNTREWKMLLELAHDEVITINPQMVINVEELLAEAKKQICPLYPIKTAQRLGFLEDANEIKCIKTGGDFVCGELYEVTASTEVTSLRYTTIVFNKENEPKEAKKLKEWKYLRIVIGDTVFNDDPENIQFILDHFDLPDPGDLMSRFPEKIEEMVKILREIEGENWNFRNFQLEDLARLLVKGGGLLAWEQGLGKTLGGLSFAEAAVKLGAQDKVLFIVPQDLLPQWHREAKLFYGKKLEHITGIGDAWRVRKHLRAGGTGWYITHYEAISRNGRKLELLPHKEYKHKHPKAGQDKWDKNGGSEGRGAWTTIPDTVMLNSKDFCPECTEPAQHGKWRPAKGICDKCGYRHIKLKVKAAYTYLTTCFEHGTIIIDEGTKMKSNTSLMSLAIRGLRAEYRLLLTGTPIKNYIPDAFWLLWWSLRNNSIQFPFDYYGGYTKFAKEFAVSEYSLDSVGTKKSMKILPEIANLAVLWKLLCSSIIRRRKEETGEPIVKRTFVPITCPMGARQAKMYENWLKGFTPYFCSTHPDSKIAAYPALVERFSAILGLNHKLAYSAALPEAEPDGYYERGSNWIPANLKVLEIAEKHAREGDKILIGSFLKGFGPWISDKLLQKQVQSIHITDMDEDGNLTTKSPAKRADLIYQFRNSPTSVLCTSIQAMMLGHNLDCANVVIIHGLPWDFSTFDQFIARVHRLTSIRDVTVYIVMTEGLIDERKYKLIEAKGNSSGLALDGMLFEKDTVTIDQQAILDELIEAGLTPGKRVDEDEVHKKWLGTLNKPEENKGWEHFRPIVETRQTDMFG